MAGGKQKQPTVSTDAVAQDQIVSFFERWRRLEEEKRAISNDLKEMFAEAKGLGFDTKVMRSVFRDKTKDHAERQEFEAIYDLYWSALGFTPARPARSARENIEQFGADEGDDEPAPPAPQEVAADLGGEGGELAAVALPVDTSNVTQFPQPKGRRWMYSDAAHKDCLDPGQCGGFSTNGLCGRCKEAAGFVQVPHEGTIGR